MEAQAQMAAEYAAQEQKLLDRIGALPVVNSLPVTTFPQRAGVSAHPVVCARWDAAGEVARRGHRARGGTGVLSHRGHHWARRARG